MTEWRHHIVAVIASNGADYIACLAAFHFRAFHQRQIARLGGLHERLEIGAGVLRDCHDRSPRWLELLCRSGRTVCWSILNGWSRRRSAWQASQSHRPASLKRSEESRVGTECVSTGRYHGSQYE